MKGLKILRKILSISIGKNANGLKGILNTKKIEITVENNDRIRKTDINILSKSVNFLNFSRKFLFLINIRTTAKIFNTIKLSNKTIVISNSLSS